MIAAAPEPPATAPSPAAKERSQPSVLKAFFIYLFIVFVGGALIAPRFYATAQFLEGISRRFSWIADQPFHRYVSRCLILLAIVCLPALFKAIGVRSAAALGLKWHRRHFIELLQGCAWGFAALALCTAFLVGCDARALDLNHDSARWLRHLKNAALAAVVVAVIEEILFRGALFGALRRTRAFWSAGLASAAIYALFHFFEKPETPRFVEWNSGLIVLGRMLRCFTDLPALLPAFINLTLVGLLLALVFERTGALHFSIGLHAGFIFWVKSFGFLTKPAPDSRTWFWGSDKLIDGWACTILMLLIFLLIERTLPPRKASEP
jgi:membrane protease YdiL (CAAX protease family)